MITQLSTPCIQWTKSDNGKGYGVTCVNGKQVYAHRVAWERAHGPIPPGMFVCHHCDNPGCVNPDHLFIGTNADNMRDALAKGRLKQPFGEKRLFCLKGHALIAPNLYINPRTGFRRCKTCRSAYEKRRRATQGAKKRRYVYRDRRDWMEVWNAKQRALAIAKALTGIKP